MSAQGTIPPAWRSGWAEPFRFTPDANPYVGHRLTVQVDGSRVACDCGDEFEGVVDLERHQQAYRHPGINSGYQPDPDETPRVGADWVDDLMRETNR